MLHIWYASKVVVYIFQLPAHQIWIPPNKSHLSQMDSVLFHSSLRSPALTHLQSSSVYTPPHSRLLLATQDIPAFTLCLKPTEPVCSWPACLSASWLLSAWTNDIWFLTQPVSDLPVSLSLDSNCLLLTRWRILVSLDHVFNLPWLFVPKVILVRGVLFKFY